MKEVKHTPGPWTKEHWVKIKGQGDAPTEIYAGLNGKRIKIAELNFDIRVGMGQEMLLSNAKLIAAAPETAAERDRLKEEIVKYQLELSDSEQERNKLKDEIKELKESLAGRDKIIDNYGVKGRELKEENERLKNSLASEVQVKQIFTIENQKLQSINRELVEALKARKLLLEEKYAMPHLVDDYNYISDLINKNSNL